MMQKFPRFLHNRWIYRTNAHRFNVTRVIDNKERKKKALMPRDNYPVSTSVWICPFQITEQIARIQPLRDSSPLAQPGAFPPAVAHQTKLLEHLAIDDTEAHLE